MQTYLSLFLKTKKSDRIRTCFSQVVNKKVYIYIFHPGIPSWKMKKEYICIHLNADNICELHDWIQRIEKLLSLHPFSSFFILFLRKRQKKAEKGRDRSDNNYLPSNLSRRDRSEIMIVLLLFYYVKQKKHNHDKNLFMK